LVWHIKKEIFSMTLPNKPPAAGSALGQADPAPAQGSSGTPAQPPQAGQQPPAAPAYVTAEEAQRIANQAAEAAFRRSQGLTEKIRQGIESQIATLKASMTASGAPPLTPEQEAALRVTMADQVAQQSEPPASAQQPAQAAQPQTTGDPVLDVAFSMMQAAGVTIEATDPEFATLKQDGGPKEFLDSVETAIAAKKVRLGGKENPTARVPLAGPQLPAGSPELSEQELWDRAYRK